MLSLPAVRPAFFDAGWSSLVARRAHNPKVVGSNPAPATKFWYRYCWYHASGQGAAEGPLFRGFLLSGFDEVGFVPIF